MTGEKSALMAWFAGRRSPGPERGRVVVVEDGAHLDPLRGSGVIDARTTVFAPSAPAGADARFVGYDGHVRFSGDELAVGDDFVVQVQGYAISQFLTVLGPTAIRVDDDDDLDAFLADADTARSTGTFAEFMVNPAVVIADPPSAWRSMPAAPTTACSSPPTGRCRRRRRASRWEPSGTRRRCCVRLGAGSTAPPRVHAVSVGSRVTDRRRAAGLTERPWLARYLVASGVIRRLLGEGVGDVTVSGFGARLHARTGGAVAAGHGIDTGYDSDTGYDGDADTAMVAWTADTGYLVDPPTGRMFAVSHRVAGMVELAGALGSVDAAAEVAADPDLDQVIGRARDLGFTLPAAPLAVLR